MCEITIKNRENRSHLLGKLLLLFWRKSYLQDVSRNLTDLSCDLTITSCGTKPRRRTRSLIKKAEVLTWGVKNVVLVPLGMFSLKKSTVGAFPVPFRRLSRKNLRGDNVLCKSWYLFGREKKFKPRVQNRILVPPYTPSFYMQSPREQSLKC